LKRLKTAGMATALIAASLPAFAATYSQETTATLRALDKITGRSTDFEIQVGEPVIYGSLRIELDVCFQTPPEEPPESAAFLKIETANATRMQSMTVPRLASEVEDADSASEPTGTPARKADSEEDNGPLFSGWMFASTPGLSALEHPVYDVWVIRCTEVAPVSESMPDAPEE